MTLSLLRHAKWDIAKGIGPRNQAGELVPYVPLFADSFSCLWAATTNLIVQDDDWESIDPDFRQFYEETHDLFQDHFAARNRLLLAYPKLKMRSPDQDAIKAVLDHFLEVGFDRIVVRAAKLMASAEDFSRKEGQIYGSLRAHSKDQFALRWVCSGLLSLNKLLREYAGSEAQIEIFVRDVNEAAESFSQLTYLLSHQAPEDRECFDRDLKIAIPCGGRQGAGHAFESLWEIEELLRQDQTSQKQGGPDKRGDAKDTGSVMLEPQAPGTPPKAEEQLQTSSTTDASTLLLKEIASQTNPQSGGETREPATSEAPAVSAAASSSVGLALTGLICLASAALLVLLPNLQTRPAGPLSRLVWLLAAFGLLLLYLCRRWLTVEGAS